MFAKPAPARDTVQPNRERELTILHAIADALNASADLKTSLAAALSQVAALFGLHTGWVFLLDEKTGSPYLAAAQNLPPGLASEPRRMTGSCYCLDTFRGGDLNGAANVNTITCSRLKWLSGEGSEGLRFHATIPLYAYGRKLGVMNVASSEWHRLSADDLRLLRTVGDMLGVAVDRAQLYARSVEAGASEERNRLAREIHDTIAQGLAATALQLETADALVDARAGADRVRKVVGEALRLTRANLEEARRSVLDLRAAPLEGKTLEQAIAALIEDTRKKDGPALRFETIGAGRRLPARIEGGFYRVAQEALANALSHAEARTIAISLSVEPDRVLLVVEDDGRGFAVDEPKPDRFGLVGLGERVRLLGGEMHVESTPGVGCRIEAAVPLT